MTTLRHHARQPRAISIMQQVEMLRPRTAVELHQFVQTVLRLKVPRQPIVEGNDAPFQYLLATYFESGRDLVVWASRGGGKTCLGAVATVLDMLYKPGIQIRILGGSRDQSEHMYRHLMNMMAVPLLRPLLVDDPTMRRLRLVNGSEGELLAQSETSVRGQRVHKLRCDELELFDRTVWNAAQRVTRSANLGNIAVRGTIEALSTFHRPFGLMNEIIGPATDDSAGGASAHASPFRVIRWSVLDVIERCPPERPCEGCPIRADCRGRARDADGFVKVDDVIAQFRRSSDQAWASEMMCSRPSVEANVYPSFVPEKHVIAQPVEEEPEKMSACVLSQPEPAERKSSEAGDGTFIAGMDFGIRSPLVMLWGRLHGPADAPVTDRVVEIVDEYLQAGLTMDTHCRWIEQRAWPRPEWIGVDPAGDSRNSQTGVSDIACLRRFGYRIRRMASPIRTGIEIIRRRLDRGRLIIHPRCEALILGLRQYHFNVRKPNDPNPVKDGPDHVCDALRYMLVNLEKGTTPAKHRHW